MTFIRTARNPETGMVEGELIDQQMATVRIAECAGLPGVDFPCLALGRPSAMAILTREQVKALIPHLRYFVERGELFEGALTETT